MGRRLLIFRDRWLAASTLPLRSEGEGREIVPLVNLEACMLEMFIW